MTINLKRSILPEVRAEIAAIPVDVQFLWSVQGDCGIDVDQLRQLMVELDTQQGYVEREETVSPGEPLSYYLIGDKNEDAD